MVFVLSYNAALQVFAAFVLFLFGYFALFAFSVICLLIATGLYEVIKRVRAYAVISASARGSNFLARFLPESGN
jgi:hypothetical protein